MVLLDKTLSIPNGLNMVEYEQIQQQHRPNSEWHLSGISSHMTIEILQNLQNTNQQQRQIATITKVTKNDKHCKKWRKLAFKTM